VLGFQESGQITKTERKTFECNQLEGGTSRGSGRLLEECIGLMTDYSRTGSNFRWRLGGLPCRTAIPENMKGKLRTTWCS
jgi:hypothetical protein